MKAGAAPPQSQWKPMLMNGASQATLNEGGGGTPAIAASSQL